MILTKKQIESQGFKVTFTNGTGAGGQKRNRTLSVAVVRHIESELEQRCDETRVAAKNMNIAYQILLGKLKDDKAAKYEERLNEMRKAAVEKGTIRTYNYTRNTVKNHETGNEAPLKKVMNGHIELINKPV